MRRRSGPFGMDEWGLAGGFRARHRNRRSGVRPGIVTRLEPAEICIHGPTPHDELRERCWPLDESASLPQDLAVGDAVSVKYVSGRVVEIRRD